MNTDWNLTGPESLNFFGKITATATHELNNSIGIINEQAGLLDDLGWVAKQGEAPDIDRWINISKKITAQVQRTNNIIKNLNKFAHSTDYKDSTHDIDFLISLIISLSSRIMAEKDVSINFNPCPKALKISVSPFLFLNLIGNCLIFARDNVDKNHIVSINCELKKEKLAIQFSGLKIINNGKSSKIIKNELLNLLNADIYFSKGCKDFQISINTQP